MRHRRWAFAGPMLLVLLLSLLAPFAANRPPAQARQADAPLVILLNGDLWQWTPGGELQQLTTWGYNQRPVLSPDGSRVAYTSWAEVAVEALASGQELPGTVPSNIWLLDVASGDGVRAAEQPGDVSYLVEGVPGRYAVRGTPSWSPDGMRLAWNELVEPNSQYQLVVYDVATGGSQVIVPALPFPFADAGHFPLYPVKWGSDGIAVMNGGFNAETGEFEETIAVYDPNGSLLSQTVVSSTATEQLFDFVWVEQDGRDMIGLLYPSGRRYVLNPLTGSLEETAATPELYSTSEPDASLTVTRTPEADESGNLRAIWTVNTSEGEPIMPLDVLGGPSSVAIAPDGQTLAYVNDAVYIWQNGQSTPVSGTEGIASPGDVALAWGGTAWRLRPAPETSAALAEATPQADAATGMGGGGFVVCAPMPRLIAGGQAQVIPGLPNVIRGLPGTVRRSAREPSPVVHLHHGPHPGRRSCRPGGGGLRAVFARGAGRAPPEKNALSRTEAGPVPAGVHAGGGTGRGFHARGAGLGRRRRTVDLPLRRAGGRGHGRVPAADGRRSPAGLRAGCGRLGGPAVREALPPGAGGRGLRGAHRSGAGVELTYYICGRGGHVGADRHAAAPALAGGSRGVDAPGSGPGSAAAGGPAAAGDGRGVRGPGRGLARRISAVRRTGAGFGPVRPGAGAAAGAGGADCR